MKKQKTCNVCEQTLTLDHFEKFSRACRDCRGKRRRCASCNTIKLLDQFHKSVRDGLGHSHTCMTCADNKHRIGNKTCATCGVVVAAIEFPKNSRECAACNGRIRKCSQCKVPKTLDKFHRVAGGVGLRRVCIDCVNERRNSDWHSRPRTCDCCGVIKTSYPLHTRICTDCYGRWKRCPGCKTVKDMAAFGKDVANPTGYQSHCRECVAQRDHERRHSNTKRCCRCGEFRDREQFSNGFDRMCKLCVDGTTHQICSQCGERKPLDEFSQDLSTALGKSYHCKQCGRTNKRLNNRTANNRCASARNLAKRTDREFLITLEEYAELIVNPCHYCGSELHQTGSGLDRIDSTGTYTPDNVVPCCKECNQAKSASFTYDEMLVIGEAIGRVKAQRKHQSESDSEVTINQNQPLKSNGEESQKP